jgi:dTDP-4-amino-4,6-dideoxygalactose transaminase
MRSDVMEVPFVDLKRQYEAMKNEIDERISDVLSTQMFILGENVRMFEREIASYCGVKCAVGVASGTDALVIANILCGVKPGDEVITVPNTFIATADSISKNNGRIVFADIDKDSCNIDPSKIEEKITKKTKVIIPVHLYGNPADMKPILEIAEENDLKVIEDAAQAIGAEYNGKKVCSFGDVACISFYPAKNLGAYGDAGMLLTDNVEMAEKALKLRDYGQREKNRHEMIGFNSRLDEIQAAVLRVKLKYIDKWNGMRIKNAKYYDELLSDINEISTQKSSFKHVYHIYSIFSERRNELRTYLESKQIHTGIHYPLPIYLQKAYQHLGYKRGSFPMAERHCFTQLSLPMFPELLKEEMDYVADNIRAFFKGG